MADNGKVTRSKKTPWLTYALIGGGALLAWNLYSRTKAAASLNFLPGKIKTMFFNGIRPVIDLALEVQNTSNHIFNVLSIAGNVYAVQNGTKYWVGTITDFTPVSVGPVSDSTIDVNLSLQLTGVISDLLNSLQNGLGAQQLILQAYANVDQLQVPINFTYNLS